MVIVTRDSDYGVVYRNKSYVNDWLYQEFKQRVSQRGKLKLTASLSEGLKIVHAKVTKEMEVAEQQMLADFLSRFRTLDGVEPEQNVP